MAAFIKPMLAVATETLPRGEWVAEEKFDGHRLIVRVYSSNKVAAWSRLGNARALPNHLVGEISAFPVGVYDGELIVEGGYSSSVTDLANTSKLKLVLFDMLEREDDQIMTLSWTYRRRFLEEAWHAANSNPGGIKHISVAELTKVTSWEEVEEVVGQIWERGGEGVILKDTSARYEPGKRRKCFLKVKELRSATLSIVGFCPSEGEIMQRGPFAMTVLQDVEGNHTIVKTIDDAMLARLNTSFGGELSQDALHWREVRLPSNKKVYMNVQHPWIGKKLAIEYQCRTPDNSYRHPRWDHLEGE